jgi:outer membrane protein assembly factor BamB
MATLEVHDGEDRVQFIELSREHPIIFGSSSTCDIVLSGEEIRPVHGRIRWKKGRFRIEASPDARFVTVNGTRMTSSSLRQGDEVELGPCRMILSRADQAGEEKPSRRRAPHPDEERTRVLEGPPPMQVAARPRAPGRPSSGRGKHGISQLEKGDWVEILDLGSDEASPEEVVELEPSGTRTRNESGNGRGRDGKQTARWRSFLKFIGEERAPGQERVLSSPLVITLLLSLGFLVLLGLGLRTIIVRTMANRQFDHAVELMEDGDYRTAIRDFDRFIEANPKDLRVGRARVLRALANVRQYVSVSGGTWSTALEAAREMVEQVGGEPAYRDEKSELADLVIRIGEALADRARRSADRKSLEEAESAVPLHAQIAGGPAPDFLKRSRIPQLLSEARAAVQKAEIRAMSLASMDEALGKGSSTGVYKARDALIARYTDLAQDPALVQRMTQANTLIQKAVRVERTGKPAATTERPEPLGPLSSLVLRSRPETHASSPAAASVVFAQVDGVAYAMAGETGEPLWQRPVGLSSPFPPQPVMGDSTCLLVDARHDELLRVDSLTGKLRWRQSLGEPVESPPLVLGNQLCQTLPSGVLCLISLETGEEQVRVNLGMPLSRAPVHDESGRFLYLTARRDCLFVLGRDPLACVNVEYLGHEDGSIVCEPLRTGRFLIIPENDRPADSRWRVLVLEEQGAKARPVQEIRVPGWTWNTPASSGSVAWATGDQGGIEAYALGDYASPNPLRSLARLAPDTGDPTPVFGRALSERELWMAGRRPGRFDLDPQKGEIKPRFALGPLGAPVAPLQAAGRRIIMSFRDSETGGQSIHALDASQGSSVWQTVLGARWPSLPLPTKAGDGLTTVGLDGQITTITTKRLEAGGFVTLPLAPTGSRRLPEGDVLSTRDGDRDRLVLAPSSESSILWVRESEGPDGWKAHELPTAMAAPPLPWGNSVLVPGRDGRVYLIDPVTSRSTAEPFVPIFDRERRGRWLAPVHLDGDAVVLTDDAGRVRRLVLKTTPIPRLVVEAERLLEEPIVADPAATSAAVILLTADQKVRALAARDLSPVGTWPLEAPASGPPVNVGGRCFIADERGTVMAFGADGRRLWAARLDAPMVGAPVVREETVWILDRAGRLYGLGAADGSTLSRRELGILPGGGLLVTGTLALVPVARGSFQPVNLDAIPERSH